MADCNAVWQMVAACNDPEERYNIMCDNLDIPYYAENCAKIEARANNILPGGMKKPKIREYINIEDMDPLEGAWRRQRDERRGLI